MSLVLPGNLVSIIRSHRELISLNKQLLGKPGEKCTLMTSVGQNSDFCSHLMRKGEQSNAGTYCLSMGHCNIAYIKFHYLLGQAVLGYITYPHQLEHALIMTDIVLI